MLQVRAAHCPNCKETTPPGADFCPVCGENLHWQTTDGKKISTASTPARHHSGAHTIFWLLIAFAAAYLVAVIAMTLHTRGTPAPAKITAPPATRSTPAPTGDSASNAASNDAGAPGDLPELDLQ